jgi:hypothetical protein
LDNGISLCYSCHKNLEKLRTKMKNMFVIWYSLWQKEKLNNENNPNPSTCGNRIPQNNHSIRTGLLILLANKSLLRQCLSY